MNFDSKKQSDDFDPMEVLALPFGDSSFEYPQNVIEKLNELKPEIPINLIPLHESIIHDLFYIKKELMYQKQCIDYAIDKSLFNDDLSLIGRYLLPASNYGDSLHDIINRISEVFYHTWMKSCDYEDLFLGLIDNNGRSGDRYISLMTHLINDLFCRNDNDSYSGMIKLCMSEEIKGNVESSYSICKAIGMFLFKESYVSFNAASDIAHKIKKHNRIRLSKASSRPKSRDYDEVINIVKSTIAKYSNASVSSLIEKIHTYYSSNNRKPPAKNTIRSWILDIGYKPKGKPVNNYGLVLSDGKS